MNHIEPLESRLQFDGGALDTSFGDGGAITIDYNDLLAGERWRRNATRFTQDSGGRIYVTSQQRQFAEDNFTQIDHKIVITRYSRDGQPDTAFGGGGYKLLDRNPTSVNGFSGLDVETFVDANNRTHVLDGDVLWRLTPGGRVDMTFGRRGKVAVPSRLLGAFDMAFDADSRAYLAGASQGKTGTRMAVVRLLEDGSWDTTWGYQSPVPTPGASSTAHLIRFLSNGQLMVAGASSASVTAGAGWITRLNADGTVDTTYGVDGYATHEGDTGSSDVHITIRPSLIAADGSVLGSSQISIDTGEPPDDASYSGFNWRFDADGHRVEPFEIAPSNFDALYDVELETQPTLQSDGKIIGRGGPDQDDLYRVNPDATLDTTWGENGILHAEHAGLGGPPQIAVDDSILTVGGDFNADVLKIYRLFRDDAPLAQFDGKQLIAPRTTATRFSVTFRDDDGIDKNSIDSADVRVFGPFDGQPRSRGATLEAVEPLGGGRFRAIYKVTSPGGWTAADNGVYSVRLVSGEVKDTNGLAAPATALGTFRVRIR
jgi:uncharacterized delta-60 repeat protein